MPRALQDHDLEELLTEALDQARGSADKLARLEREAEERQIHVEGLEEQIATLEKLSAEKDEQIAGLENELEDARARLLALAGRASGEIPAAVLSAHKLGGDDAAAEFLDAVVLSEDGSRV